MVYNISPLLSMFLWLTHMKILLKMFGFFFFFHPIWQSRLVEGITWEPYDNALCPFLLCNPRFMIVCLSQEGAGLKK